MKLKYTGVILIVLGALLFVVRASDISFMSSTPLNAISLALFLGLPFIGATLLFGDRYLRRPPGIDNDHIYHKSISARGTLALLAGFGLTALYIIVYLGSDFVVSIDQAAVRVDGRGQIVSVEADEDMRSYLDYYCTECEQLTGAKHNRLFAFADELHQGIQSVMRGEQDEFKTRFGRSYINAFEVQVAELIDSGARNGSPDDAAQTDAAEESELDNPAQEPGFIIQPGLRPVTVNITRTDTLHHFFARHVYSLFDPLARIIRNKAADNWFFYGTMYTYAMLLFGLRMFMKYRHSRYQILRTASVMFFQLGFAYLIPHFLVLFQQKEFYFSYFWPLKPEYLYPSVWLGYLGEQFEFAGAIEKTGFYFILFALFMTVIATPLLTFLYGKRWYCSWVCGCGGLAETLGDPFRHLSDKSLRAWQIERWMIHSVLVVITLVTGLLWTNSLLGGAVLQKYSDLASRGYGLFIGSIFSGIVGVGFYPLLGSRVWCRFGCPMAAILGIFQKYFSRFRITTNGGQCISCGNCSTYCEMGIDVRWYAQRGQNIIRASCVGCGVCSAVCPRGVLNLENGSVFGRYNGPQATVLHEPQ